MPNLLGLGPLIQNLYSDTDPDRKMETSGSWAVHRTRKKQLCFAWPIASISCSWFFISWKQSTFHCLPSVSSLQPSSFPPCLSTPSPGFTSVFVNSLPLTLQDWSEIANIYLALTTYQFLYKVLHICRFISWMKWCYPHFTDVSAEAQKSNLPKVT